MPSLADRRASLVAIQANIQSQIDGIEQQRESLNQAAEPARQQIKGLAEQINYLDELIADPDVTPVVAAPTDAPAADAEQPAQ